MSIEILDEFKKLADKAIESWGIDAQLDMVAEECAELIVELMKRKRVKNGTNEMLIMFEGVDVEIMIDQLKNIINKDKIWDSIRAQKLKQLKVRLKEHEGSL